MVARNVTVANNTAVSGGGGIASVASNSILDLGNSLLTANTAPIGFDLLTTAPTGFDLPTDGSTAVSAGSNFIRFIAGNFSVGEGDIIGSEARVLGDLASNGGPTQTHALLPGSSPVDKGNPDLCASIGVENRDQRGIARPQGVACDIGAFELGGATPTMGNGTTTATTPTGGTPGGTTPGSTAIGTPTTGGITIGTPFMGR